MILKIAQLGHPVLRQVARPLEIEEIREARWQGVFDAMLATLEDAGGAGLAAPQVHLARRILLAGSRPTPDHPERPTVPVAVFVNPRIVARSAEIVADWEGCLSFSELMVRVPRSRSLGVEYFDRAGEPQRLDAVDFLARVLQHEIDHLDGILTLDRATSSREIVKAAEWRRFHAKPEGPKGSAATSAERGQ